MIGARIGNYTLVSSLGRGGMGEVFLAQHRSIGTRVAIKMLHADISQDDHVVQRFFNEALATDKIEHSGICKIHDVGHHDGRAYLMMEYLKGESLAQRIRRTQRMSSTQIGVIGKQIASVLAATHRAGIVHRDLKPENVFLIPDEDQPTGERVKVLDFGIAKLTGTLAGASPKTSGTMGTPAYMAPEQWTDSSSIDWRVDAYALGCVVFEMACGRPPFVVPTIGEACSKHLTVIPPTARSLVPDVPVALDALLVRLLAKRPEDRPPLDELRRTFDELASRSDPLGPTITSSHPIAPTPVAIMVTKPVTAELPAAPPVASIAEAPSTLIDPPRADVEPTPPAPAPRSRRPSQAVRLPPPKHKPAPSTGDDGLRHAYRLLDTTLGGSAGSRATASARRTPLLIGLGVAIAATVAIGYGVTRTPPEKPVAPSARPRAAASAEAPAPSPDSEVVTLAKWIASENPFSIDAGTARLLHHQVTRGEYRRHLEAALTGRFDEPPNTTEPQAAMASVTYEEAARFCSAIDARLPTSDEWELAARMAWGIPGADGKPGPLQEWTSTRKTDRVVVRGGHSKMSATQLVKDAPYVTLKETKEQAGPGAGETRISGETIGFRCAR